MIYVWKGLEWNGGPQSGAANKPCKGSGRSLRTAASTEPMRGGAFRPLTVTLVINTYTWAAAKTDAVCHFISADPLLTLRTKPRFTPLLRKNHISVMIIPQWPDT